MQNQQIANPDEINQQAQNLNNNQIIQQINPEDVNNNNGGQQALTDDKRALYNDATETKTQYYKEIGTNVNDALNSVWFPQWWLKKQQQ